MFGSLQYDHLKAGSPGGAGKKEEFLIALSKTDLRRRPTTCMILGSLLRLRTVEAAEKENLSQFFSFIFLNISSPATEPSALPN